MSDQPPTIEQATALYAENERLRADLAFYGRHTMDCPAPHGPHTLCTCGLTAALGEVEPTA